MITDAEVMAFRAAWICCCVLIAVFSLGRLMRIEDLELLFQKELKVRMDKYGFGLAERAGRYLEDKKAENVDEFLVFLERHATAEHQKALTSTEVLAYVEETRASVAKYRARPGRSCSVSYLLKTEGSNDV